VTGSSGSQVAVRVPLDPGEPVDPFTLAGEHGVIFHSGAHVRVGLGRSRTLALPRGLDGIDDLAAATGAVVTIPCDDRHGSRTGPVVAFGALPFDRPAAAHLVIPEIIYGRDGDDEWVTVVTSSPTRSPGLPPGGARRWLQQRAAAVPRSGGGGGGARVVSRSSDASFRDMVVAALDAIGRGELAKVVVARHMDVHLGRPVDRPRLLRRWHDLEPNATVFSVPTGRGHFLGASPELLVERCGSTVRSRPLAGTAERRGGAGPGLLPEALLDSPKDANEHRLVVTAIADSLRPLCDHLNVPDHPDLVVLRNIVHLGSALEGTLTPRSDGTVPDALALAGALHPTPAVGGVPPLAARALIDRLEPEPRGHYAGPVGYVDSRGDGRWMVGIRAMTVRGADARLSAGVGIVDGSVPDIELVETNLKLTAVLDALVPGLTPPTPAGSRASAT